MYPTKKHSIWLKLGFSLFTPVFPKPGCRSPEGESVHFSWKRATRGAEQEEAETLVVVYRGQTRGGIDGVKNKITH